ncbi:MFS transporter [Streptomyces virginiae]
MYALYIGVAGVLLALQVEDIDPANKVANFGLIAGVSAIFATVFNPVAGALSDRSGRRNPWILGGGLAAVPAMFLLGLADTILLLTIAWCLGQAVMNVYQAAITSVVPDRVPMDARGKPPRPSDSACPSAPPSARSSGPPSPRTTAPATSSSARWWRAPPCSSPPAAASSGSRPAPRCPSRSSSPPSPARCATTTSAGRSSGGRCSSSATSR